MTWSWTTALGALNAALCFLLTSEQLGHFTRDLIGTINAGLSFYLGLTHTGKIALTPSQAKALLVLGLVSLSLLHPTVLTAGTIVSEQHNVPYTATVDVDSTAVEIVIDFDGNGLADSSRLLSVVHITGDGAYCVERGTATATGAALTTGQVWTFNRRDGGQPVSRLSCITAATEGATVAIWADR